MPITPNPMPFGFSGQDIASMANAREGLVRGFEELGKQVRSDITRIGTMRQLKSFGEEMANLDPQSDLFPQQAISTLAKYPLAANTQVAEIGLNLLGRRHRDWKDAQVKGADWMDLGGGTYNVKGVGTFKYDDAGNPSFVDVTPNVGNVPSGRIVDTTEGQKLIDPVTGATIENFGPRPSRAFTGYADQSVGTGNAVNDARIKAIQKLVSADLAIAEDTAQDVATRQAAANRVKDYQVRITELFRGGQSSASATVSVGNPGLGISSLGANPAVNIPSALGGLYGAPPSVSPPPSSTSPTPSYLPTPTPNPGAALLPGNQNAPLPGEETILPGAESQSSFRTPQDVQRAYKRGTIDKTAARRILQEQFGQLP